VASTNTASSLNYFDYLALTADRMIASL